MITLKWLEQGEENRMVYWMPFWFILHLMPHLWILKCVESCPYKCFKAGCYAYLNCSLRKCISTKFPISLQLRNGKYWCKKLTEIACLSNIFVEVILFVMFSWCKAQLSDVFTQLWRNLCHFVCNCSDDEDLQYRNHTVFRTKMSSSRKKDSLFELVESSADFCTEDIREHWQRGRTLSFKVIYL